MNVLITGATGMLGTELRAATAQRGWTVSTLSRGSIDPSIPASFLPSLRGQEVVIHAAANTNVEACETDPVSCYRDNALLTESLAAAARTSAVRMVYVSSTGVYGDHSSDPYHEYDAVRPPTHHHRAKHAGELAVLRSEDALVIRTGWLFGGDPANPKNFVARRIEEAARSPSGMRSNALQKGCPTYARDVATRVVDMIVGRFNGVFNCVNEGSASRFEYVQEIVRLYGLDTKVEPSSDQVFARKARVSNNEMALNLRQDLVGLPRMRSWRDALLEYMEQHIRPDFRPD